MDKNSEREREREKERERERDVLKGEGWCSLFVHTHFLAANRLPTSLTLFLFSQKLSRVRHFETILYQC